MLFPESKGMYPTSSKMSSRIFRRRSSSSASFAGDPHVITPGSAGYFRVSREPLPVLYARGLVAERPRWWLVWVVTGVVGLATTVRSTLDCADGWPGRDFRSTACAYYGWVLGFFAWPSV